MLIQRRAGLIYDRSGLLREIVNRSIVGLEHPA